MPRRNTGKTITKIKKFKNKIAIYFDSKKIDVSYDTFTSFYLYVGKTMTMKEYKDFIHQMEMEKFLKYALSVREKNIISEYNLREKLYHKEASKDIVDRIIKFMKEHDLLDDYAYALDMKSYLDDSLVGKNKIILKLKNKGIFDETISKLTFSSSLEKKKAKEYLEKIESKFNKYNTNLKRKKIINALLVQGYSYEIINDVISTIKKQDPNIEEELLKKDYEKVFNKLSKKYEGKILKEKIIASLYNKGYSLKKIIIQVGENDDGFKIC